MKLKYLVCILLALFTVFLFACRNNNNDTDTETDTDTYSDTIINTDPSGPIINGTEIVLPDDEFDDTDASTDTNTDTNTDTSFDTNTDADTDTDTQPEPEPEPIVPSDVTIKLFENGQSEYTIVYPKNNEIIEYHVKELVSHISTAYGVTIPYKAVDRDEEIGNKEIVVGYVRKNVLYAASSMSRQNDFILDVCDDDYVIYAPNDALYSYAFRVFEDEILSKAVDGALTIKPDEEFSFKESAYKDMSLASYVKAKANASSFNQDLLCQFFVDLSFTASDNTTLPYRLYLPSSYDASVDYPVILFLHGAGERGNDNYKHMNHVIHDLFNQENTSVEDAIIICPQCPEGQQWVDTPWTAGNYSLDNVPESNELKAVVELLDKIKNQFSTDEDRYYAMGISMGGFGTWDLIMRHTELFAAAVPICGGADVTRAELLKDMPIYTAHGTWDDIVPYSNSTKIMVQALKDAGSTSVIYKEYSAGHVMWQNVAQDPAMLKWLFLQKKNDIQLGENETPLLPR